jgi:hypothetical protein
VETADPSTTLGMTKARGALSWIGCRAQVWIGCRLRELQIHCSVGKTDHKVLEQDGKSG